MLRNTIFLVSLCITITGVSAQQIFNERQALENRLLDRELEAYCSTSLTPVEINPVRTEALRRALGASSIEELDEMVDRRVPLTKKKEIKQYLEAVGRMSQEIPCQLFAAQNPIVYRLKNTL